MDELLSRILDAHGGADRWNAHEKVHATIISGGGFFALKGAPQDSSPRRMTVVPLGLHLMENLMRRQGSHG